MTSREKIIRLPNITVADDEMYGAKVRACGMVISLLRMMVMAAACVHIDGEPF